MQIVAITFMPYLIYMVLMLVYCIEYVPNHWQWEQVLGDVAQEDRKVGKFFDTDPEYLDQSIIRVLVSILAVFLTYIEVSQMVRMRGDYWQDKWNYGNLSVIILNMFIVIEHSTRVF